MSEEGGDYYASSSGILPHSSKITPLQSLARTIQAAHESGTLFFSAAHLRPLLEDFREKNGPSSTIELEELIAWAAKAMVGE
jgi:hypothetical protein